MKAKNCFLTIFVLFFCCSFFNLSAKADELKLYGAAFQYSTKFFCGLGSYGIKEGLSSSEYTTIVKISNPGEKTAQLNIKLSITEQMSVSQSIHKKIGPNEKLEIDCNNMFKITTSPSHIKGLLIIESNQKLDVIPTYKILGKE